MYPDKSEEVQKFIIGIMDSLHDESTRPQIMAQLTNKQMPIAARVGAVAASVVSSMLRRVMTQANGRKPHLKLILKAIKLAVLEASKMAMAAGIEVSFDEKKEAAKIAGEMIESGETAQQQGQQPQQQQGQQPQQQQSQQGLIGGVSNG